MLFMSLAKFYKRRLFRVFFVLTKTVAKLHQIKKKFKPQNKGHFYQEPYLHSLSSPQV